MIKNLTILIVLGFTSLVYSQQASGDYKEYSYTELFKMIEEEQDSVFELKNAKIWYVPETDSLNFGLNSIFKEGFIIGEIELEAKRKDTIVINKELKFQNVQFASSTKVPSNQGFGALHHIKFLKPVQFENTVYLTIMHSTFWGSLRIEYSEILNERINRRSRFDYLSVALDKNTFKNKVTIWGSSETDLSDINFTVSNSSFNSLVAQKDYVDLYISLSQPEQLVLDSNELNKDLYTFISPGKAERVDITNNTFGDYTSFKLDNKASERLHIKNNTFGELIGLELDVLGADASITWPDFRNKVFHSDAFRLKMQELQVSKDAAFSPKRNSLTPTNADYYLQERFRITDEFIFKEEMNLRGKFYELYKMRHDNDYANMVYQEMKDMETLRLQHLYSENPNFKTYFTWKVNQFLKVFSAYGTEPSKAIVVSLYVILLFALIYLFFPNSWDKHGKNRIVDRYNFFFKYMKRKAGIHEVYMEDQKEELMSYEQFKANISNSKQKVPKFFTATALPLYKWAVSGTKLSAGVLRRIDIISGTWQDLPPSKRLWKSILLVGAFLVAILYDLIIKILNALMLSINTFTTLGFGEIPIKGLPRYLAIIQGFIGWFMLTIFSVSLISQLLN